MKLIEKDTFGDDINIAHLTDRINYQDLQESQDCLISVQYNELDFGNTAYGFNQPFLNNEANLYFERMKTFSETTINDIIDKGIHSWHFYRTGIKGNLKKVFDKMDSSIPKSDPMIFHFALDPNCKIEADRKSGSRNPRIYFMVGYKGMIHPIFFDPYHELNPM